MKLSLNSSLGGLSSAFTMAEILLSLTIIGVVAAITLPSLTGNINERTWATQKKALHSRLSQAVSLLDGLRGYGNFTSTYWDGSGTFITLNSSAETFLASGLAKVFKLNNICSGSNITDCGMPSVVTNMAGSKVDLVYYLGNDVGSYNGMYNYVNGCGIPVGIGGPGAAFETANGESVAIIYNPGCRDLASATISWDSSKSLFSPTVSGCVNFIYDLNGKKGPNIVGKDVGFMTAFYPNDSVVAAPIPVSSDVSSTSCSQFGDEARVPSFEELASMSLNYRLIGESDFGTSGKRYHSSGRGSVPNSSNARWLFWASSSSYQIMQLTSSTSATATRCVKR